MRSFIPVRRGISSLPGFLRQRRNQRAYLRNINAAGWKRGESRYEESDTRCVRRHARTRGRRRHHRR